MSGPTVTEVAVTEGAVTWTMRGHAQVPEGDWWLTDAERHAQRRFVVPKRRADWRCGRWSAKALISAHAGVGAPKVGVLARSEDDGFPLVHGLGDAGPTVSISHSDGVAIAALAPAGEAIGCDLERTRRRSSRFERDWFTTGERELLERASGHSRDRLVTRIWSVKEAALKATGEGLRRDTRDVEVHIGAETVSQHGGTPRAAGWGRVAAEVRGGPQLHGWCRELLGFQLVFISASSPTAAPPTRIWPDVVVSPTDFGERNYCPIPGVSRTTNTRIAHDDPHGGPRK